jgi:hypothetical protein
MRNQFLTMLLALAGGFVLVTVSPAALAAQGQTSRSGAAAGGYQAPRSADGQPDLSGVWQNNDATPFQRPKELEGRVTLTDAEVAALEHRAGALFNGETDAAFGDSVFLTVLRDEKTYTGGDGRTTENPRGTGNYNHFWIVDRPFDNRTSIISDPSDGKLPPLTEEGKRRAAEAAEYRKAHPADGPEDLPLSHRCVTFGAPRIGAGYNSYFQIIQSKDYVAIYQEMIHDVRIVPLDGRPHVNGNVKQWLGDARGHWEGDTLVIETTNFLPETAGVALVGSQPVSNVPVGGLRTVERFTRIAKDTIKWDVTANNPDMFTSPWTATVMLRSSPDQIYEMACHEGNEGLPGALSGERALEKQAATAAARGSN